MTIEVLETASGTTLLESIVAIELIDSAFQGPPGPPGASGIVDAIAATISTDPDNRLTTGSDSGLFVPEILIDPLAYYILSRS